MNKWMVAAVLGVSAAMIGVAVSVQQAQADDHGSEPAADAAPQREVDLAVISDPSHEAMNQTAPDTYEVLFRTTAGDFTVAVTRAWSPNGADRFYNLVKNGYYDGNKFFRVVPGFVVQWGLHGDKDVNAAWYDPANRNAATIEDDEVKESNTRGRIVFATSGPDSRTTQLFINFGNNRRLDGMGFSPFGEVTGEGMDVVDEIYDGYGEPPRNLQGAIVEQGNSVLDEFFPKLDGIITATIVEDPAEEAEAE